MLPLLDLLSNKMDNNDCIKLVVLSPERTVLEVQVSQAELPGERGRFTVLRNHAPLISSLDEGEITYKSAGALAKMHITSGFVEINENNVTACVVL